MNYLLKTVLQKEFRFRSVEDVLSAFHLIKSTDVSALIVDIDYFSNHSWEFIEHLRSSKIFDFPIIILASENTEMLQRKSYELGVDEIFFKPFNPVDLIASIRGIISHKNDFALISNTL